MVNRRPPTDGKPRFVASDSAHIHVQTVITPQSFQKSLADFPDAAYQLNYDVPLFILNALLLSNGHEDRKFCWGNSCDFESSNVTARFSVDVCVLSRLMSVTDETLQANEYKVSKKESVGK